jgi:hypothetical protein
MMSTHDFISEYTQTQALNLPTHSGCQFAGHGARRAGAQGAVHEEEEWQQEVAAAQVLPHRAPRDRLLLARHELDRESCFAANGTAACDNTAG